MQKGYRDIPNYISIQFAVFGNEISKNMSPVLPK